MLVQSVTQNVEKNQVELYGYWKGTTFSANQMVHVMDHGNFSVEKVEILNNQF